MRERSGTGELADRVERKAPQRSSRLTRRSLVDAVGERIADQLMREHGGHRIPQVTTAHQERAARDARIRNELDRTGDYEGTAQQFKLSPRQVKNIAKGSNAGR